MAGTTRSATRFGGGGVSFFGWVVVRSVVVSVRAAGLPVAAAVVATQQPDHAEDADHRHEHEQREHARPQLAALRPAGPGPSRTAARAAGSSRSSSPS